MNLEKSKILLEKINALHKSMSADPINIATIEKDLMRSYVQQFYEACLETSPPEVIPPKTPEPPKVEIIKSTTPIRPRKPPIVKRKPAQAPRVEPRPPAPEPAPTPRPTAKAYTPPRVIDLPDSLKSITESVPTPPPPPKPTAPPPPAPKPTPPPTLNIQGNEEVEALFDLPEARELSEKLSALPIKDLRKAMGFNEKIFTINELFGGDQGAYDTTIVTLNSFNNFDQAKEYLIDNVAVKYNWGKRSKKNKASNFIKLVRRRYN